MSSFYDDQVWCPKCGHTPVLPSDTGPHYLYICQNTECDFKTEKYEDLVQIDGGSKAAPPTPPKVKTRESIEDGGAVRTSLQWPLLDRIECESAAKADKPDPPPTERPDVEGARSMALDVNVLQTHWTWSTVQRVISELCDHALALEAKLKTAETERDLFRVDITKLTGDCGFANSHLAMLVKAGNGLGLILPEKGSMRGWCGNHQLITPQIDVRTAKKFLTALTAAKQYRESGEKGTYNEEVHS